MSQPPVVGEYVYLTAPTSRLAAVIDLDEAVVDGPQAIAAIAERANPGNGESVYAYLKDLERGYALPIRTVREYEGFTAEQLATMLDGFHPPQGYTLIDKHPKWVRVCDQLTQAPVVRELVVDHPAPVSWELGKHTTSIRYRKMLADYYAQPPEILFAHQDQQLTAAA